MAKVTVACDRCGTLFTRQECHQHSRNFCSSDCYHQATVKRVERQCLNCGATFQVVPSEPRKTCPNCPRKSGTARTGWRIEYRDCPTCGSLFVWNAYRGRTHCRPECAAKAASERMKGPRLPLKPCLQCGTPYKARRGSKYCGRACRDIADLTRSQSLRRQPRICVQCGKTFEPRSATHRRCSALCRADAKRGALNPMWKGGRTPKTDPHDAVVYLVRSAGAVKIGFSTNLSKRLEALRTGCADDLELLGTVPGGRNLERRLHTEFAEHRLSGEWFALPPEVQTGLVERFREATEEANRPGQIRLFY